MINQLNLDERIFIAGASGMAGNAIYKELKASGYGDIKENGIIYTPNRKELNLLNFEETNQWFKINKPTIVIIAAAKVGGIFANSSKPADFLLDNIKIEMNIIEASWKYGVKRLLFLGSSCIYPKFADQPIKEESLLTGQLEKTNEGYAVAKIAGIKLCNFLREQYNFDAISLMPTNLYGPGDNYDSNTSHVMPALIKKFCRASKFSEPLVECWGSGNPLREFMHVNDLGKAVIFVLRYWDPNHKDAPKDADGNKLNYLNVGTGKDISIKDLSLKIANKTGFKGSIIWDKTKPDGTPKKQLDVSRILELGWKPSITLDEGIEKTILEYKKLLNIES